MCWTGSGHFAKHPSDLGHMQKGFKLLQTDLEGGEELQEATNGVVQTPQPYYPQLERAHSLPGAQRCFASEEDLSLTSLVMGSKNSMDESKEETSLEPSLELGRTKKPKVLCEHSKVFLTSSPGHQPNRHQRDVICPAALKPSKTFPTTALQQAPMLQVKLEPA